MACCKKGGKSHLTASQIVSVCFDKKQLSPSGEIRSSYISGHELLTIIQVLHSGHPLGAEVVVIWVGGHQQHVWNKEFTRSRYCPVVVCNKISKAARVTNLTVLVSSVT